MLVEMKVTTTLMLKTRVMLAKEELKHGDHKDASKKHTREEMHREIVRARDNWIFSVVSEVWHPPLVHVVAHTKCITTSHSHKD